MYKLLLISSLICLASCKTLTVKCIELSKAQYATACGEYGSSNVQLWRMKNDVPNPYSYHMQVKVKIDGKWYWLPNEWYTEAFSETPQPGCKPLGRVK